MSNGFKAMFDSAVCSWLSERTGEKVDRIVAMEEETRRVDGACDTCGYTMYVLEIAYTIEGDSFTRHFDYRGDLMSLISDIDRRM